MVDVLPEKVFREYDIRGIVDEDLTPARVKRLALAVAYTFRREGIDEAVVGMDNRKSSPVFFKAIAEGLRSGGVDVVDIGVVPTPVFYFAVKKWQIKGGIMITASHNPPEFNGFKVYRGESTIYGADIKELYKLSKGELPSDGKGELKERDIKGEYINYLLDNISIERNVKFAVDGGNGTSGIVVRELFKGFNLQPTELYIEPDGNFPNHHPDPTVLENLKDLIDTVKSEGLELGIGFDGDSDRIGVVDNNGRVVWGDRLLALFSRDVLASNPGGKIIFEVKCSRTLIEDIEKHGGVPIMWKTGHSLIKKKMKEEGALIAGEMSGHIFFADRYFGFDDAIYAACRLLEIVSRSDKSLSELLSDLPELENTPEIRLECSDEKKFEVVEKVKGHFSERYDVIDVDGARINFENGWGLVRASNTQPVLVLRFEADSLEALEEIKKRVADYLSNFVDVSPLFKE